MAVIAIEDQIYDFLEEQIAEIDDEASPLFAAELLDSPYASITKEYGIQIDDGESIFSPSPGADEVWEFDGHVTLIVYRRVAAADRTHRKEARSQAIALAMAVSKLLFDDPTMGNRVNDARVLNCLRGWANIKTVPYCIMNLPMIVNESGGRS